MSSKLIIGIIIVCILLIILITNIYSIINNYSYISFNTYINSNFPLQSNYNYPNIIFLYSHDYKTLPKYFQYALYNLKNKDRPSTLVFSINFGYFLLHKF